MTMRAVPEFDLSRFPLGDGDSMPEITSHKLQADDLIFSINLLLEPLPRVQVWGNHFVYYNPENPNDNVAPDVYVALDVNREVREAYFAFAEGKFPDLIIEIISPNNTKKEMLVTKRALYARLGVREYYVHDPLQLMRPPIQAFHRVGEDLVPAPFLPDGGIWSEVLGTELRLSGRWLRVVDPSTGGFVPTPAEQAAALQDAERIRTAVEARLTAAEARAAQETQAR